MTISPVETSNSNANPDRINPNEMNPVGSPLLHSHNTLWRPITAANGWTLTNIQDYAGFRGMEFMLDTLDKHIFLRGVGKVITAAGPTLTVPVAYRPIAGKGEIFASGTDTGGVQQFARVDVPPTGVINWIPAAIVVNSYVTLSGLHWWYR